MADIDVLQQATAPASRVAPGSRLVGVKNGQLVSFGTTTVSPDAVGDGVTDDYAAFVAARDALYAAKGGVFYLPYREAGYVLSAPFVIDVAQYAGGGGITINLNGNTIRPSHTGWAFDVETNYFGVVNNYEFGRKPVVIKCGGGRVVTSNTAAAGAFRFTDTVCWGLSDVTGENYLVGDVLQLYISTNDQSTWVEHGEACNVKGTKCLQGLYLKSAHNNASFLGNVFRRLCFEGNINNVKNYNLEGLLFDCLFENCGGYYNQQGKTGGCCFYLNGGFTGTTITNPWVDGGGAGAQSHATDIVFGPRYTTTQSYFPLLVNTIEIQMPIDWRDRVLVAGPTGEDVLSGNVAANPREVLRNNRTYYVNPTGSDAANTGLYANSPFATFQRALDVIYQTLDCASKTVTIKLADGTYTGGFTVRGMPAGIGTGALIVEGNMTTPGNVILSAASADAFRAVGGSRVTVQGLEFRTTTSGAGIKVDEVSRVSIGAGCRFGACATAHITGTNQSQINVLASYGITGNAPLHWNLTCGSLITAYTGTIDASNRTFANFIECASNSVISLGVAFTSAGSSGSRYYIHSGGIVQTFGAGATYLPGSANGYADSASFGAYL